MKGIRIFLLVEIILIAGLILAALAFSLLKPEIFEKIVYTMYDFLGLENLGG